MSENQNMTAQGRRCNGRVEDDMDARKTVMSAVRKAVKNIGLALTVVSTAGLAAGPAWSASRIKDIAQFEGVRENQLVGYGIVVGLNGTGDTLRNSPFTQQSLTAMLERLGVNTRDTNMRTDNVAAVMVTANLPPFARQGNRVDASNSALGDAESLRGGTLLVTPLMGADGEIYAVAQGPVAVGGFSAGGEAENVTSGVPTSGRITNGAIVEKEVDFEFANLNRLELSLNNPDMTTASRVTEAINRNVPGTPARTRDPGTIDITPPEDAKANLVGFLADVEQLMVEPDDLANVVINEKTGVIVMGSEVRLSTVAIAQGNLTIRVTETPQVSQPNPFSEQGETVAVPRTEVEVEETGGKKMAVVEEGVTLQSLVDGLNALGIGPRDMISILQALKAAGALHAKIEVM